MATIADQIDTYLRQHLESIRQGYTVTLFDGAVYTFRTDAGQSVSKNLEYTETPDVFPAISYYPGKNSATTDGAELGMEIHTLEVSVEGFLESGKGGDEGDDLQTDLGAALRADPWWGGLLDEIRDWSAESTVQVGDYVLSIAKVSFTAVYTAPYGSE